MISNEQFQAILAWVKANNFSKETKFGLSLADDGWCIFPVNLDDGNVIQHSLGFAGEAPDDCLGNIYSLQDLSFCTVTCEKEAKKRFMEYLLQNPPKGLFQAFVDFLKTETNIEIFSLYLAPTSDTTKLLNVYTEFLEGKLKQGISHEG